MDKETKEKLIEGFKEIQYEKFNLCDVDLKDAQGANLMYAIEDTIKSTVDGMNAYHAISKMRQ